MNQRHRIALLPLATLVCVLGLPYSASAGLHPDSRDDLGLPPLKDTVVDKVQEDVQDEEEDTSGSWRRSRTVEGEADEDLRIPILVGVEVDDLVDTWGDARSNGRTHEGIDIMAPRGALIVSPNDAVVAQIGTYTLGGKYVYTSNPGGERFYFAHMDGFAEGLREGQRLKRGDLIGYVGNTGNAIGGPTHLHFTIYRGGARNPYPRLTRTFTNKERVAILTDLIEQEDTASERLARAQEFVSRYRATFATAQASGVPLSSLVSLLMGTTNVRAARTASSQPGPEFTRDLERGDEGPEVEILQRFLIAEATGDAALQLQKAGATGYFGRITENALAEYQRAHNISPAVGYLGLITRTYIHTS